MAPFGSQQHMFTSVGSCHIVLALSLSLDFFVQLYPLVGSPNHLHIVTCDIFKPNRLSFIVTTGER